MGCLSFHRRRRVRRADLSSTPCQIAEAEYPFFRNRNEKLETYTINFKGAGSDSLLSELGCGQPEKFDGHTLSPKSLLPNELDSSEPRAFIQPVHELDSAAITVPKRKEVPSSL